MKKILGYLFLGGAILGSAGFLGLSSCEKVYAETSAGGGTASQTTAGSTDNKEDTTTKTEISVALWLEMALKVIYLVMWPLLAIAGAAMDNSLVYGKIFFLDTMLWKFWNIMRSFSNFALGILFMIAVIKPWFDGKSGTSEIFTALKNLVLGALLVNMSWFIMSALIDLSTVATVGIGGIPLVAVGKDENFKKIRFLKPYGLANLDQSINELQTKSENTVFYGCANDAKAKPYFLPCYVEAGMLVPEGPISEPKSWAAYKEQFLKSWEKITLNTNPQLTKETVNDDYCVMNNNLVRYVPNTVLTREIMTAIRDDGVKEMQNRECLTLDSILQNAKGMSGPLFTLYASLLNTSELGLSTNHKGVADVTLEFLMRVAMSLMLLIPLLAFAVIMIMRVAYLWLIIAASPIIALVLTKNITGMGETADKIFSKDGSNIVSLIFLPVIATFAVSLAVVFLSLLQRADFYQDVQISELLGISTKQEGANQYCYDLKLTSLCINESRRRAGNNIGNTMSYLFINGFGIALMWTVVFAALKTSKITDSVVQSIQTTSQDFLASAPLLPTPWGKLSASGVGDVVNHVKSIPQQMQQQQYQHSLADTIERLGSGGEIKEIQSGVTKAAQLNTSPTEAKNVVMKGISSPTGNNYKNYDNFFDALARGANLPTNHGISSMQQAFSNSSVMNSYGLDGMKSIYEKWNGHTQGSNQANEYYESTGKELEAALQTQAQQPGNFKANFEGSRYYFVGDRYVRIKNNNGTWGPDSFEVSTKNYKTGTSISSKEHLSELQTLLADTHFKGSSNLLTALGSTETPLKAIITKIASAINLPNKQIDINSIPVTVTGSGNNITSFTISGN